MSQARNKRNNKKQYGQFFTPNKIVKDIVDSLVITKDTKILEPGCGNGAFVIPLIAKLFPFYTGTTKERLDQIFSINIWAIELDESVRNDCMTNIRAKYGYSPDIIHGDFLRWAGEQFDVIVGNPPFGGTIDYALQDSLDKIYGWRNGHKIKKETYSFFIVKSIDHLKPNGTIKFICSDTFLTISTMTGLRRFLMEEGQADIKRLDYFSEETNYPMVLLSFNKTGKSNHIVLDNDITKRESMEMLDNFSWTITDLDAQLFKHTLKEKMVCTGGMTTGKNEYFVREIKNGFIEEPYRFEFFEEKIELQREIERARLNYLSERQRELIGKTRRTVRIVEQEVVKIELPNPNYRFYNKASSKTFYSEPTHVIYWKDDGDAVKTFKKNGNWYLHGVGGQKFFGREGLTWNLIGNMIKARYLPSGYILDSGAPCGFTDEQWSKD